MQDIKRLAIYPPLGIARVGNSDEYFLASEIPGRPAMANEGFKDSLGRVKKQVAKFRIFAFDGNDKVIKELTTADGAEITWRVHVANRKAGWYQFNNALDLPGQAIPSSFRNNTITGANRKKLIIDPAPRKISGNNISGDAYSFTGGKFFDTDVPLGEIRTDEQGRLLVFGGTGTSASHDGTPANTFANNDGWHDDVSDGTVRATVTYGGENFEAEAVMVAITPPNFGQGLFGVVTMHDVVYDLYIRSQWISKPQKISFWEHIYPILERTVQTQWVNEGFYMLFGFNSPSDFTSHELLDQLSNPSDVTKAARVKVFKWFRKPDNAYEPAKIPPFYGDAFDDYKSVSNVDLPLTLIQYEWMEKWSEGEFEVGAKPGLMAFEELSPEQQINSLNKAPLEECLGGPFHPGIELTWPFRNLIFWEKPYRIKLLPEDQDPADDYGAILSQQIALSAGGPLDGSGPGSLTRWLGVPWQTDEASCLSGYDTSVYLTLPSFWAARVPNQILAEDSYMRLSDPNLNIAQRLKHFDYRQDWLRDLGTQYLSKINKMIKKWHELGIIVSHPLPVQSQHQFLPAQLWVESDRATYDDKDATFEQVKTAEDAQEPMLLAAKTLLDEVAGRTETDVRPFRVRPVFRRDEL